VLKTNTIYYIASNVKTLVRNPVIRASPQMPNVLQERLG
jgi:CRISPR/Cas system-associated protein Csm6